jgi:hypothetical protein
VRPTLPLVINQDVGRDLADLFRDLGGGGDHAIIVEADDVAWPDEHAATANGLVQVREDAPAREDRSAERLEDDRRLGDVQLAGCPACMVGSASASGQVAPRLYAGPGRDAELPGAVFGEAVLAALIRGDHEVAKLRLRT